jgi:NADPH:quinone reductase-like Zn-dependent oxidoreductase/NADP-dependent 3-hydroxy acid dehydrogenase YdfG/acyl carrier protein
LGALDQPAPRLYLVTRGANEASPTQALLWGLGRVAASEQPALRCTLVDLCAGFDERALFEEVRADSADDQVSYRDGERTVARLVPSPGVAQRTAPRTAPSDAYRLAATAPGSLDSLRPVDQPRTSPGPGQVEVRIEAAALNFLDVLKAMGVCPGFEPTADVALGAEAAGIVTAVGAGVDHVRPGDAVVAITPSYRVTSMLASYATVPAGFVLARPSGLSAEQASALAVAYITAYYTLCEIGHLRAGERVLVHAATGGVGLAAIEICRLLGAEVIATAGSKRKRAHLRSLGVEHVLDSRTLDFARDVLDITDGRGVDLVLNSLTGEAIPAGLSVLAPRGRFLEIGKRDVYGGARLDLSPFRNNLSLHVVDLAAITEQDPAYMADLFRRVMVMVADGQLPPLPVTAVPVGSAADAFREMAQAGHIGKLVVTVGREPVAADALPVRPDGTYLVTGGTRGLGLAVAGRLVELGARHLALVARGDLTPPAQEAVAGLRQRGAAVQVVRADVGDAAALGTALATVRATMPPLRGVVHAAGVLADATIDTMDPAAVHSALVPKLHGGWNLHRATLDDDLDHFVLFSSVAGVLGATGQANYAAGNAFLDALAAHRRAAGRRALSIEWGPWAEIGLAAEADNRGTRLADRGLGSLDPEDGLDAFAALLPGDRVDVAVMPFDAARWAEAQPTATGLLTEMLTAASAVPIAGASLRATVELAPGGPLRRRAMEDGVCAELAPVLRVAAERIDRWQPFKAMGVDSLMALELRNRLERVTGLTLPATIVWNFPTVAQLAGQLAALSGVALDAPVPPATPAPEAPAAAVADVGLSREDLELQLLEELAAADRLLGVESS